MAQYNDVPLMQLIPEIDDLISKGATVHQKWTCRHCNARQTMEEPNTFYKSGRCEECDKISVIDKCGYTLILSF